MLICHVLMGPGGSMSQSRPGGTCGLWTNGVVWGTFTHGDGRGSRASVQWPRLSWCNVSVCERVCACVRARLCASVSVCWGEAAKSHSKGHGYQEKRGMGLTIQSIPSCPPALQIRCQPRQPEPLDEPDGPQPGPVRKCL